MIFQLYDNKPIVAETAMDFKGCIQKVHYYNRCRFLVYQKQARSHENKKSMLFPDLSEHKPTNAYP